MTIVRVVDPSHIDQSAIDEAAAIIRAGGLVAFPTETVYGLGADATNADAVSKIFLAKGRPTYNPLIVHVQSAEQAESLVTQWPESARALAAEFWPGPLTLVLPKQSIIPDSVSAGLDTVGVRVPRHPVALALLRACGKPLAAPSANRSMQVSPTDGRHVTASLGDRPDMILDAGPVTVGIESTVLDLSGPSPTILRPGMISRSELQRVVGPVGVLSELPTGSAARRSPGMTDRHYSPRARLVIADPSAQGLDEAVVREARGGKRVVVLALADYDTRVATVRPMPLSPGEYARLLFATLHSIDADEFDAIVVEAVPDDDAWEGVRDRLRRAATP